MEWISMKEQKPPERTDVLVWDTIKHRQGWQPICLVYSNNFTFLDNRYSHWMMLPKAPYPAWEERE